MQCDRATYKIDRSIFQFMTTEGAPTITEEYTITMKKKYIYFVKLSRRRNLHTDLCLLPTHCNKWMNPTSDTICRAYVGIKYYSPCLKHAVLRSPSQHSNLGSCATTWTALSACLLAMRPNWRVISPSCMRAHVW